MTSRAVYRFEGIGDDLDLVPLAGRRALDAAALKVGLAAWRTIPLAQRTAIVAQGASERVDAGEVRRLVAGAESSPIFSEPEPDAAVAPDALARFGVDGARWTALGALDRWALASLARRGRDDSVRALLAELDG